jgi:hypothetical protein
MLDVYWNDEYYFSINWYGKVFYCKKPGNLFITHEKNSQLTITHQSFLNYWKNVYKNIQYIQINQKIYDYHNKEFLMTNQGPLTVFTHEIIPINRISWGFLWWIFKNANNKTIFFEYYLIIFLLILNGIQIVKICLIF